MDLRFLVHGILGYLVLSSLGTSLQDQLPYDVNVANKLW
jgi:hypothetical protein